MALASGGLDLLAGSELEYHPHSLRLLMGTDHIRLLLCATIFELDSDLYPHVGAAKSGSFMINRSPGMVGPACLRLPVPTIAYGTPDMSLSPPTLLPEPLCHERFPVL